MSGTISLPHVQQSAEGACLLACTRMVLAHLGLEYSESELGRVLGVREFGTPSFAIWQLASLGLEVTYREWSIPQLLEALDAGRPVIAFVRTGLLDYWRQDVAHAVVIVGIEVGQTFWLHDPVLPAGPSSVSWNGLLAAWAEFAYRGATIERAA